MINNNFLISNVNGDVFELKYNNKTFEIVANKKKNAFTSKYMFC